MAGGPGRANQRQRTRKDLLQAAATLMRSGQQPTLDEVAAEALVSRATAYRHFPGVESLLLEAALDIAFPQPSMIFSQRSADPILRLEEADAAVQRMMKTNEPALRMMLVQSLQLSLKGGGDGAPARRQNRRTELIEAALAPARDRFDTAGYERLVQALALVIGTESMLVLKDVLELGESDARDVRRWTIRALVGAAQAEGGQR